MPGFECDIDTWTRLCETNEAGIETCSICNTTAYDLGKRHQCYPEQDYFCPNNDYEFLDDNDPADYDTYDYEYPEPKPLSERCDKVGKTCLRMSQCNMQNLSDSDEPPLSCGFDKHAREDKFCCAENSSAESEVGSNNTPQSPQFNQSGQAWPCVDHTEMCAKWVKGCDPNHESYQFMKYACMETCKICKNDVRYFTFTSFSPLGPTYL